MAQEWPVKAVTFLNPFPAGGGTDAFARPLAAQLTEQLGKQFIIDNRGGAGGTVGASVAAKAALMATPGLLVPPITPSHLLCIKPLTTIFRRALYRLPC